jgi:hypothetical protein
MSNNLTIAIRCDFPPKTVSVQLASNATLSQIQAAAAKGLEVENSVMVQYRFSYTGFGTDITECSSDKEEKAKLESGFTVFCAAPGDLKPQRKSRKKKAAEEEKSSERKDEYKGFSTGNALAKFLSAKAPKELKLALEYIDMYTTDILKTTPWVKLNKQQVSTILARDWLSCDEQTVFEAMLTWGKAEAKRLEVSDSKDDLKKVLADLMLLVRFPTMEVKGVAMAVNPSGLLESQQILDLFTYLSTKNSQNKDVKLPDSLKKFNAKPRVPRKKPDAFKWSEAHKHSGITISNGGLSANCGTSSNFSVGGDIVWDKGQHEWEWEITGSYLMCGIVPEHFNGWVGSGGHIGDTNFNGWGLYTTGNPWTVYRAGSSGSVPNSIGSDTTTQVIIRCKLDLDKGTCEFFKGGEKGQSTGVSTFSGITGSVRPAVTLYSGSTMTIRPL